MLEKVEFEVLAGSVIGRRHVTEGTNGQDHFVYETVHTYYGDFLIAVVSDGCGDVGNNIHASEVGSKLLSSYVLSRIKYLLQAGVNAYSVMNIPDMVFGDSIGYLNSIVNGYNFQTKPERLHFISNHLLATVVGLIIGPEIVTVFHYGDGVYQINDEVTVIDQANAPYYLAYHLIQDALGKDTTLPQRYTTVNFTRSSVTKVAIGTDSWKDELTLLNTVWGLSGRNILQRQMRVWSRLKHFKDDAALIAVKLNRR